MNDDERSFFVSAMNRHDESEKRRLGKLKLQLKAAEDYEKEMMNSRREGYEAGLISALKNESPAPSYKKDFPAWAPPVLRVQLAHYSENNLDENHTFILKKLCTDKRMKNVWENLSKNFRHSASVQSSATVAYLFAQEVSKAYWGWKGWGALTKKQGDKKIKTILKLLSDLSNEIRDFPISESIISDLTHNELGSLQVAFVRHTLQTIDSDIPGYFGRVVEDAAYDYPVAVQEELYMKDKMPSLCEVLERTQLKLSAATFESRTTSNSDTGRLRFFIRSLAGFMSAHYGSRKDAQLAEIGNIFFDDADLDVKKVSDLFR